MIGKVAAGLGGAGLALAATAGKGFLEGAIGKTASGGFTSGLKRARSGARGSPKTTGLTGDPDRDSVIASRDLQSDVGDQKQILKSISQEASGLRETLAEVGTWIVKNDLLLTKIFDKLPSQLEKNIDNVVKGALTAAGLLGAGGAAAAAARAAAPRTLPRIGGLAGVAGGLGLDYAADKAGEAGYEKTSGALGAASYAAGGAGIGGMIGGARGAAIGGAVGGLYGLYQNMGKLGGVSSSNGIDFTSSREIVFKADKITFRVKSTTAGSEGVGSGSGGGGFTGGFPGGANFTGQGLTPGVAATGSAAEAIQFFQSKGWTREQAAGIAANIQAESNFKTNAVGDGGRAYGIAQWHRDRQKDFQKVFGKDIRQSSFQEQLAFIDWELRNTESRAGDSLRNASTAAEAAAIVQNQYERPANKDPRYRASIAMGFAGEGGSAMAVRTTPTGTGPAGAGGSIRPQSQMGGMTGQNGRLDAASLTSIGTGHKLESSAASAYQRMVEAAKADGVAWGITDSYRTYESQVRVAQQKGLYSQGGLAAYPGTSKHGWGRAVDLRLDGRASAWLQQNAGKFGFKTIAREPWHWEYTGDGGSYQTAAASTGPAGGGGSIRPQSARQADIPAPGAMAMSGIMPPGFEGIFAPNTSMVSGKVSPAAGRVLSGDASQDEVRKLWERYNETGSPADFVRADQAMRAMQAGGGQRVVAQGGGSRKAAPKKGIPGGIKASATPYSGAGTGAPMDAENVGGVPGFDAKSWSAAQQMKWKRQGIQNTALEMQKMREEDQDAAELAKSRQYGALMEADEQQKKDIEAGISPIKAGTRFSPRGIGMAIGGGPEAAAERRAAIAAENAKPAPGGGMDGELVGGVPGFDAKDWNAKYKLSRAPDTASSAAMGAGLGGSDLNRVTDPQALQRMSEAHSNYMREQFEKQTNPAASAVGASDQPWSPQESKKSEPAKESGPPAGEYLRDLFGDSSYTFGAGA